MLCVDDRISFAAFVVQRNGSTVQGEACWCIRCASFSFTVLLIPFIWYVCCELQMFLYMYVPAKFALPDYVGRGYGEAGGFGQS